MKKDFNNRKVKKHRVLETIGTIVQSILTFVITFAVLLFLVFLVTPGNTKEKFADAKEYLMATFGKADTEVAIEQNPIEGVEENKIVAPKIVSDTVEASVARQVTPVVEQKQIEKVANNSKGNEALTLSNSMYYIQLDQYGKKIYDKLSMESAYFLNGEHSFNYGTVFNELLNRPGGAEQLEHSFQAAVNALALDFPQLYFIDVSNISLVITEKQYMGARPVYTVKIENAKGKLFYADGIRSKDELDMIRNKVEALREKIIKNARRYPTQYEQIKYVHDYIVDNVYYDDNITDSSKYNLGFTLLRGRAVCEGYAKSFKYILDGMQIPTITTVGIGINSVGSRERHAWNQVYLDGYWYGVDTTWDDPIVTSNSILTRRDTHKYFLVGENVFKGNHIPDGNVSDGVEFKYPQLPAYSYTPPRRQ